MSEKRADIVVDLGFGDSGKGTMVDYLARKGGVSVVVRSNGGAQSAHNVVTPDGRHHTFRQFGSGSFVPGVNTFISGNFIFNPIEFIVEAQNLTQLGINNPYQNVVVDQNALVTTPLHVAINQTREILRGSQKHGTCGMGIGETVHMSLKYPDTAIRVYELIDRKRLLSKLQKLQDYYMDEFSEIGSVEAWIKFSSRSKLKDWVQACIHLSAKLMISDLKYLHSSSRAGNIIFETSQGVLLDEWYGFHPHTTWSTTTAKNPIEILKEIDYQGEVNKLGVLRSYLTRHGEGPFPSESEELTNGIKEPHNTSIGAQGVFRSGWFDVVLARYANRVVGGVDSLAITHLDTLKKRGKDVRVVTRYLNQFDDTGDLPIKSELEDLDFQSSLTNRLRYALPYSELFSNQEIDGKFLERISQELKTKISVTSYGPSAVDKRMVCIG